MRIAPGVVIAQRYRLENELARGGMGAVWVARHLQLGTPVAVKFMDPGYAGSASARVRFEREARAAAQLQSAHVVRVFDYGIEDDTPFLVMELLQGEDLGARIKRGGPLPLAAAAEVLAQVARALRQAHEAGIVHRDLKPGNIFLVREGGVETAKVLDFGLARMHDLASSSEDEATRAEQILGSPQYMSPEQTRHAHHVDGRSDLWALAIIAYRAITGKLPFTGASASDIMVKACTEPALPPSVHKPELPRALDAFFEKALAKEPDGRFQTATELSLAFAAAAGVSAPAGEPSSVSRSDLTARPAAQAPVMITAAPRPRSLWGVSVAVFVGLGAVVAGVVVRQRSIADCAEAGDATACRNACWLGALEQCGRWHELGCESPTAAADPARLDQCETACKAGRSTSCASLADAFGARAALEAEGSAARSALVTRRLEVMERGCGAGDRAACLRVGTEGQDARALATLERLCTGALPGACPALAARLAYGYAGAPPAPGEAPRFAKEAPRALALFEKGCAAGTLGDCEDGGVLLLEGEGVTRDETRARGLFEKAIATTESPSGGSPAERASDANRRGVGLAWMMEHGRGGARDAKGAAALLDRLCSVQGPRVGFAASCLELAFLLRVGRGVAKDAKRSDLLAGRVCSPSFRCTDEARRREIGWLRPRDLERAAAFYEMACSAGEEPACARTKAKK